MLLKFLKHTKGTGNRAFNYLLGKNRDRDGAELLRGDPELSAQLINSLSLKQKNTYTSAVLAFGDDPNATPEVLEQAMNEYQEMIAAGLEEPPETVFIKHEDKGNIEIHAITPKVGDGGKAYNPYYSKSDLDFELFDNWKNKLNIENNLIDPNDPIRSRVSNSQNLRESLGNKKIKQAVNQYIQEIAIEESGISRERVIEVLQEQNFEITKQTKKSISFTYEGAEKPIRLSGEIYKSDGYSPKSREELLELQETYRAEKQTELDKIQQQHNQNLAAKVKFNQQQFSKHKKQSSEIRELLEQQNKQDSREFEPSSGLAGSSNRNEVQEVREETQLKKHHSENNNISSDHHINEPNNSRAFDLLSSGFNELGGDIENYKIETINQITDGQQINRIGEKSSRPGTTNKKNNVRNGNEKREEEIQEDGIFGTFEIIAEETARTTKSIDNLSRGLSENLQQWTAKSQSIGNVIKQGIENKQRQNRGIDESLRRYDGRAGGLANSLRNTFKEVIDEVKEVIESITSKIKNSFKGPSLGM